MRKKDGRVMLRRPQPLSTNIKPRFVEGYLEAGTKSGDHHFLNFTVTNIYSRFIQVYDGPAADTSGLA